MKEKPQQDPYEGLPEFYKEEIKDVIRSLEETTGLKANPIPIIAAARHAFNMVFQGDAHSKESLVNFALLETSDGPYVLRHLKRSLSPEKERELREFLGNLFKILITKAYFFNPRTLRSRESLEEQGQLRPRHVQVGDEEEWGVEKSPLQDWHSERGKRLKREKRERREEKKRNKEAKKAKNQLGEMTDLDF